jgi:hypothetical protein
VELLYIEQPNTVPNAITQEILEQKYELCRSKIVRELPIHDGWH